MRCLHKNCIKITKYVSRCWTKLLAHSKVKLDCLFFVHWVYVLTFKTKTQNVENANHVFSIFGLFSWMKIMTFVPFEIYCMYSFRSAINPSLNGLINLSVSQLVPLKHLMLNSNIFGIIVNAPMYFECVVSLLKCLVKVPQI